MRKRKGRVRVMKLEKRSRRASVDEEEMRRKIRIKLRERRSLKDSSPHSTNHYSAASNYPILCFRTTLSA
jgi:hypothetical protein